MKLPTHLLILTITYQLAGGLNVRSNLDFDDEHNKPRIIERVYSQLNKNDKTDNASPKIGVICASGGCNTTSLAVPASKGSDSDAVSADVVVQVQVNANDAKTKSSMGKNNEFMEKSIGDGKEEEEDIPDVPVVIGYGGGSSVTPQEHVVRPDNGVKNPNYYHHHHQPQDHVKTGGGFLPTLGLSVEFKSRGHYPNDYTKYHTNGNGYGYGFVQRPRWNYNPAPWYRRDEGRMTPQPPPATTCVCHPNSVWAGTTPATYVNFNHPGKQINDKLAPLH